MPDGFATFVGAAFLLVAAIIAYKGVDRQLKNQTILEQRQVEREKDEIRIAFYSELILYMSPLIKIISDANNAIGNGFGAENFFIPYIADPVIFKALKNKIGLLGDTRATIGLLTFYMNLKTFSDLTSENTITYVTAERIIVILKLIFFSLRTSLTLLAPCPVLPLPIGINPRNFTFCEGKSFDELTNGPTNLLDFLSDLASAHRFDALDPKPLITPMSE